MAIDDERVIARTSPLGLWHPAPVCVDGQRCHHLEGWLQFCKHCRDNPEFARKIASTPSASEARCMGDERLLWADLDLGKRALTVDEIQAWHARRTDALRRGLRASVEQNARVRRELLSTGTARLRYDDESAYYAGAGNRVGLELMEIRDDLVRRGETVDKAAAEATAEATVDKAAAEAAAPPPRATAARRHRPPRCPRSCRW